MKTLFNDIAERKNVLFILATFSLLVFLLSKDAFGVRTLIPNFEPYPDTFHYVVPPRSFISGDGWFLSRDGMGIRPSVPPLYSIYLLPFYLINLDARTYYLGNFVLALISFFVFYKILKKIRINIWVSFFSLFIYATNYYLYWYPQWAMAENLVLPLFLFGILLIIKEVSLRNVFLMSSVVVGIVATKYAYFPLSLVFTGVYGFKIFSDSKRAEKYKGLFKFLFTIIFLLLPLLFFAKESIGLRVSDVLGYILGRSQVRINYAEMGDFGSGWFSVQNLIDNFPRYARALLGNSERFLWDFSPIMTKPLATAGIVGVFTGLFSKRYRFLSFTIISSVLAQTLFMSSFYAVDMRYLYPAIPALILGFSILASLMHDHLKVKGTMRIFRVALVFVFLVYCASNLVRIKNHVMLNLKYTETPWYYVAIQELNNHFAGNGINNRPIVISPLPPYLVDFYSNGNYDLLPLSLDQDFKKQRHLVWGEGSYSDLSLLYQNKLSSGKDLYLYTAGIGNVDQYHKDFKLIDEQFLLIEVFSKCHNQCRLYKFSQRPI